MTIRDIPRKDRAYLLLDEVTGATVRLTWADLENVNDADTLEEIATIAPGARVVLGMCDVVVRVQ